MNAANGHGVPRWLTGVWRRRWIERADGVRDDRTIVFWLQTPELFADIRIPAERAPCAGARELGELDDPALRTLLRQEGFAGRTELRGGVCHWHRELDFQPPTGTPDVGRLERRGDDLLIEEGVHVPYVEEWERVAHGDDDHVACRLVDADAAGAGRTAALVAVGDFFLFVLGRRHTTPPAASLGALVSERQATRSELIALLDMEVSFGRRRGGAVPWEVRLSTLPFREGRPLDIGAFRPVE